MNIDSQIIKFIPISEVPPRDEEEYLVRMFKDGVQDKTFTVALWSGGNWYPDAGFESTITHFADISHLQ